MIQIYVGASVITAMQFITIQNNFLRSETLLVLHLISKAREFQSHQQSIPIFSII